MHRAVRWPGTAQCPPGSAPSARSLISSESAGLSACARLRSASGPLAVRWDEGITRNAPLSAVSGSGSCVTNASGTCAVDRNNLRHNQSSVTFTVTGVAHGALAYDGSTNLSVTITKP